MGILYFGRGMKVPYETIQITANAHPKWQIAGLSNCRNTWQEPVFCDVC